MRILLGLLMLAIGCSCSKSVKMDRSTDAFSAGDMTLVSSCQTASSNQGGVSAGVDSCRFTTGDTVAGNWVLIAPAPNISTKVVSGTVDVYFKDLHKSYSVNDHVIPISFSEFLGIDKWTKDFDETVLEALVTVNWTDNEGLQKVTRYRGVAVLLITDPGYERLPIDSANQAWGMNCRIQYTPAGRSSVICK